MSMSISEWATTLSGFLAVFIAIGVVIRWTFKRHLEQYLLELKPNHGSSLNDTIKLEILPLIKELRSDQIDIKEKVAKLEGRFEQHIDESDW